MYRILLKETKENYYLSPCTSKFFGLPGLWNEFEWPEATDGHHDDQYYIDFICQINCAEAAEHDKDGILPKTGMLYFFYDKQNGKRKDNSNTVVFYYDGDLYDDGGFYKLLPSYPEDYATFASFDSPEDLEKSELALEFEFDEYKGDNEHGYPQWASDESEKHYPHYLLGIPGDPGQMGLGSMGKLPDNQQLLFTLNNYVGKGMYGIFNEIHWLIEKDDLAKRDFSKACTVVVYD